MESVEASPPKEILAAVGTAAVLAAWQASSALTLFGPAPLTWRNVAAAALVVFAAALAAWLAQSQRFVVTSESLEVTRLGWPGTPRVYLLKDLSAVGVSGTRVFGNTVIKVRFGDGAFLLVPRYYANSGVLFRALFSQLGRNVEAKNAV